MKKTTDNERFVHEVQAHLKSRGHYRGKNDGWAGSMTRKAYFEAFGIADPSAPTASTNATRLYEIAARDKGLKETPGKASTPRIRRAILEAASWLNPDDSVTAWCGCIMGLWFTEAGLTPPAAYYRAANWLNVGKTIGLATAKRGDVVVLSRPGGNHVGLYHSHSPTRITLLGGNQSNAVNLSTYAISSLRGIRSI